MRHLFQQYIIMHGQILANRQTCIQGRKHPTFYRSVPQHFRISNVVLVIPVALDKHTEYVFDGILVSAESRFSEFYPATLFSLNPFLVYFRKGYTVILIDNIQQPDIFFELLWYFHFQ